MSTIDRPASQPEAHGTCCSVPQFSVAVGIASGVVRHRNTAQSSKSVIRTGLQCRCRFKGAALVATAIQGVLLLNTARSRTGMARACTLQVHTWY